VKTASSYESFRQSEQEAVGKHKQFLLQVARDIETLLTEEPIARSRFKEQCQTFKKKDKAYWDRLSAQHNAAQADPQLLDYNDGNPPKEGYVWDGFWREPDPDDLPNMRNWFYPFSTQHWPDPFSGEKQWTNKGERLPNDQERLMYYYVLLAIVHDNAMADRHIKRLYFNPYHKSGGFDFQDWGNVRWKWLSDLTLYAMKQETSQQIGDRLNIALTGVKADLTASGGRADLPNGKPVETEQNAAPAKRWGTKKVVWFIIILLVVILVIFRVSGWPEPIKAVKWFYSFVFFLAALFTCLYHLGWLGPIKSFIYRKPKRE
jgi:hypothetical protein